MNIAPLIDAPLAVQVHLAAVAVAIAGIAVVILGRKGSRLHKLSGRVFVLGMAGAAVSSFWIMDLNDGRPSFIHIISVVTLLGLARGVDMARQGRIRTHRFLMASTAVGGLGIAGAFAVLAPHRLIWQMFFG
ncbi:MAG: DUF2306 domain-containing protein [Aestuariivirgaceae bacterium]